MTKLFTILPFLLGLTYFSFSQDLTLSGEFHIYKPGGGKLYYSETGKKFNPKNFITYDGYHRYTFKMSLDKIRKSKISTIEFSTDSTREADGGLCSYFINVGAILALPQFKKATSIELNTDLEGNPGCEDMEAPPASMPDDETAKFSGKYEMNYNGIRYEIYLSSSNSYYAKLSQPDAGLMDVETGTWEYNSYRKKLFIEVTGQLNETINLKLHKSYNHSFEVTEVNGTLQFKNADGKTLSKKTE